MTRTFWLLAAPLLLGTAACNVSKDERNDQTVLSVDRGAIANGVDKAANTAERAADKAGQAIEGAVPVVKNTAREIGDKAERAADDAGNAVERVDVDVNVRNSNADQSQKR